MMKVLCIKEATDKHPDVGAREPIVKVGNFYEVMNIDQDSYGVLCYELFEDVGYLYNARLFIPCSNIDELELIKERESIYA